MLKASALLQEILVPAMHEGESFSFSMCNPPFFETIQEAGRNPHTAYAGCLPLPLLLPLPLPLPLLLPLLLPQILPVEKKLSIRK